MLIPFTYFQMLSLPLVCLYTALFAQTVFFLALYSCNKISTVNSQGLRLINRTAIESHEQDAMYISEVKAHFPAAGIHVSHR